MKKMKPSNVLRGKKRLLSKLYAILLIIPLVLGTSAMAFDGNSYNHQDHQEESVYQLTQEQLDTLETLRKQRAAVKGLFAFDGDNDLADDDSPARVIVMFDESPAEVQVIEAMADGMTLSMQEAEANVQSVYDLFQTELNRMFSNQVTRSAPTYEIWEEYHHAFLGVSLILPSNMVEELIHFESVLAVFPDEVVTIDPIVEFDVEALNEGVELAAALSATRNISPFGMTGGRAMMRADAMHALGYKGEGVLVAVVDTGIEYFHPAFDGAFPTLAEMHSRGATHIAPADLYYIHAAGNPVHLAFAETTGAAPWIPATSVYLGFNLENTGYHFLGRNTMHGFNGIAGYRFLGQGGPGNPVDYPAYLPLESFTRLGMTSNQNHGTHVAGTIVGRDSGHNNGILGVAPEAKMVSYRALASGGGSITTILRAYEWAFRDGADVVNSSLGGTHNALNAVHAIGINNMMLANPYIVFVNSAGNAGAGAAGFTTVSDPSSSTRGITVSALAPQWPRGATFVANNSNFEASVDFLHANSRSNWTWHPTYGVVNSFENFPADGNIRIFAMPRTAESAAPEGQPGSGIEADFNALVAEYGAETLNGAFVLVSRGSPFNDISIAAGALGMAGVISINGPGQASPALVTPANNANPNFVPFMLTSNESGLAIRDMIAEADGYIEFGFDHLRFIDTALNLAGFSSRGPLNMSYEIKPDIGAHGQNVWSARPRSVAAGYGNSSGTSMSAPHISGAVALLINYSRENHESLPTASENGWDNEEIKFRLMNTAIRQPIHHVGAATEANIRGSVFDTGAGQANVFAAAMADTYVYVLFDRVLQSPHPWNVPIEEAADLGTHRVGSFSFGGVNRLLTPYENHSRTLTATIHNTGNVPQTYTISHEWILYGHSRNQDPVPNGVNLRLSADVITVPPGQSRDFTATMNVPFFAANGHYEGFITVRDLQGNTVASMPFASVVWETHPLIRDVQLYRPVISTGDNALNESSKELGLMFRTANPLRGIGLRTWVYERADGLNELNWMEPQFADNLVGFVDQTEILASFPAGGGAARLAANQLHRAIVFEGYVYSDWEWVVFDEDPALYPVNVPLNRRHIVPTDSAERVYLDEGDYLLVMELFETNFLHDTNWMFDLTLPFYVDNTLPEIRQLEIDGVSRPSVSNVFRLHNDGSSINILGNVFDQWTADAAAAGTTFDIWQADAPQRNVSIANNVAVFMEVEGEPAVRLDVMPNGNFGTMLTDVELPIDVTLHVVDGFSVVPRVDRLLSSLPFQWMNSQNINQAPRAFEGNATFQLPGGFIDAEDLPWVTANRLVYTTNPAAAVVGEHVWSGVNLLSETFTLEQAPTDFTITFDPNGGTVSPTTRVVPIGAETFGGAFPMPRREGYRFLGWFTEIEGGRRIVGTGTVHEPYDFTLFARWERGVDSLTVTFDPTGGTVNPTYRVVRTGETFGGAFPMPRKQDYVFLGWFTAPDGGGNRIMGTHVVNHTTDFTLFAHWRQSDTITVTFNANGGTTTEATRVVTPGATFGGAFRMPVRDGYTFEGWFTAIEGGKRVIGTQTVTQTHSFTLFARWRPVPTNTIRVTFDPVGGTTPEAFRDVVPGETFGGAFRMPHRGDHVFTGWFTTPATGGARVMGTQKVTQTADFTLFARWTTPTMAVKIDLLEPQ